MTKNISPQDGSTYFSQSGSSFFVKRHMDEVIHPKLPGGNYAIKFNPNIGYFLERIADFPNPTKVYGEARANCERIYNSYKNKSSNLGVVLFGEKGSGKTLLGRLLSLKAASEGVPTLFITTAFSGESFFQFLYSIQQECIIFIDEYEKVYDAKDQQAMLTVLDGVFQSKKMFILTCNDRYKLDTHIRNRPGRVHYLLEYNGLSGDFIREFCQDSLTDKTKINQVVQVCSLFSSMNFDMLQALIWEMNLYNEPAGEAIRILNARPENDDYANYNVEITIACLGLKLSENMPNRALGSVYPTALSGSPLKPGDKSFNCQIATRGLPPEAIARLAPMMDEVDRMSYIDDLVVNIEETALIGSNIASNPTHYSGDPEDGPDDESGSSGRVSTKTPSCLEIAITVNTSNITKVDTKTNTYTFTDKFGNEVTFTRSKPGKVDMSKIYSQLY